MLSLLVTELGLAMSLAILLSVVDTVRGSFSTEFVELCEWSWLWVLFNSNICWRENLMLECDGIASAFSCFSFCIFTRLLNCCAINDACDIDAVLTLSKLITFWWDVLGLHESLEIVPDGLEFWLTVTLFSVISEFVCCVFTGDRLPPRRCLDFPLLRQSWSCLDLRQCHPWSLVSGPSQLWQWRPKRTAEWRV